MPRRGLGLRRLLPARVSRRHVIGGALAAGTMVTALRLLGLDRGTPVERAPGAAIGARTADWTSPLGVEAARITHLLRRATFGASPEQLEAAFKVGYGKLVDMLVETAPAEPPAFPATGGDPYAALGALRQWWVDHMLASPTPFAERMTLFWHGHFTSDFDKVGFGQPYLYWQNLTWRRMALTDLGSMLTQVTTDPAMMRYLDLDTSTGRNPNENYSRELLELFTIGAGRFTEGDVRAAARALAGWRQPTGADNSRTGIFDPLRAYTGGPLTFLGRTGRLDTRAIVDAILASPATAAFIATKVIHHFVSPAPDPRYVQRLADELRTARYDMKTLMRSVFLSPEFMADRSYRALIKSPVEYMVSALKALQAPQLSRLVLDAGRSMGQVLFNPPDVGGWPNNDAWISSNTVIARVNFATTALARLSSVPPARDVHQLHLDGVLSRGTAKLLAQAPDDRSRWLTVLMSPEFNLK